MTIPNSSTISRGWTSAGTETPANRPNSATTRSLITYEMATDATVSSAAPGARKWMAMATATSSSVASATQPSRPLIFCACACSAGAAPV